MKSLEKKKSSRKNRLLIKFKSVVLSDCYVLDTKDPFMSDGINNHAGVTQYLIDFCSTFIELLQEKDVTVLYREFRNVIDRYPLFDARLFIDGHISAPHRNS